CGERFLAPPSARQRQPEVAQRWCEHAVVAGGRLDHGLELIDGTLVLATRHELPSELGAHEERAFRLALELALVTLGGREVAPFQRQRAQRAHNRLTLRRFARALERALEVLARPTRVSTLLQQVRHGELGGRIFRLLGGGASVEL